MDGQTSFPVLFKFYYWNLCYNWNLLKSELNNLHLTVYQYIGGGWADIFPCFIQILLLKFVVYNWNLLKSELTNLHLTVYQYIGGGWADIFPCFIQIFIIEICGI